MPRELRVGGEIDALCTRCRMVLAHTILALVGQRPARVQCNTCDGQHNFHAPAGGARPRPRANATEPKAERVRVFFDEALATRVGPGRSYSPRTRFLLDEVVVHPAFGRGYVAAVRQDKIDVVFKAGTRTLVHGRG